MRKATFTLLIFASQTAYAIKTTKLPTDFISDDSWKKVAEAQLSQSYTIVKGDNLYNISKKLFGDPNYWPKIWQINGAQIPNPDLIYPSNVLTFMPGSGTSLPSLALKDSPVASAENSQESTSDSSPIRNRPQKFRSQEWRDLPTQSWEEIQVSLPPSVDSLGFDLSTRYVFPPTQGLEIPWSAASEEYESLGTIIAAKGENSLLTSNDWVYIRRDSDELQAGKTYTITTEPAIVKASIFSRKGYAYPILGRVKIVGEKEGIWIGRIQGTSGPFQRRSSFLINNLERAMIKDPVPAKEAIEANFLTERGSDTKLGGQHKIAFIDRGTNDGVVRGMVFRAYQYVDPATDRKITKSNAVVLGDVQVLQVSERFSLVLVIRSLQMPIESGSTVVALTDVSDLIEKKPDLSTLIDHEDAGTTSSGEGSQSPTTPEQKPVTVDELDKLESQDPLSEEEQKNINQLEIHRQKETAPEGSEEPSTPEETTDSTESTEETPSSDSEPAPSPTSSPSMDESPTSDEEFSE